MAFSLVQDVTDKGGENEIITEWTERSGQQTSDVTDKVGNGRLSQWDGKSVSGIETGMPIGLLLSFTYTR